MKILELVFWYVSISYYGLLSKFGYLHIIFYYKDKEYNTEWRPVKSWLYYENMFVNCEWLSSFYSISLILKMDIIYCIGQLRLF